MLNINSPANQQTVPTMFQASGTTDEAADFISATLTSGEMVINGAAVINGQNWSAQFAGLQPGTYVLTVTAGASAASITIVVTDGGL
jgi:hypothetical protein